MNQKELLNRAFPDPQIREDRIRLIASRFSEVLLLRYHNQIKSLGVKIQCARNKEEVEEVLYYIEESLIKRAAFLKSQGVATILEHVMSSFYVPDIDSEDYHYVFTNQSEEQKQSIRVIYDKYWDLVEEAIPSINRDSTMRITLSGNAPSRLLASSPKMAPVVHRTATSRAMDSPFILCGLKAKG